ncbi:hypothetical protein [Erysipelothrix aquatica]|uniref:hypothetical protein n=1 Tax=Erysipelothrix aquatica TaxID=2683714 RepID=UPI00135A5F0A|nr:hypothetical protein [Erysipelothrix aquatica]
MLKTKLAIVDHKKIERIEIVNMGTIFNPNAQSYNIIAYLNKHPLEQEQVEVKLDSLNTELEAAEELNVIFDEYNRLQTEVSNTKM